MKRVYESTQTLDLRARDKFGLSEDILMENAASALASFIKKKFKKGSKILGVCGVGNNAADVVVAIRMLSKEYKTALLLSSDKPNDMLKKQLKIAKKTGVKTVKKIKNFDCIVDGLFGSGLNRELDKKHNKLIKKLNSHDCYKLSCDIPSGINKNGDILSQCFRADTTITMGARKASVYSDMAKDYVGDIKVANLGISSKNYETKTDIFLLEKKDMKLPFRAKQNVCKGNFGHVFIISGQMSGASLIAAKAAFTAGAGKVSLISKDTIAKSKYLMQNSKIKKYMNVGAIGMGLSKADIDKLRFKDLKDKALVLDAGICHHKLVVKILKANKNTIITPHPKEFCSLLKLVGIADIDTKQLCKDRLKYAKKFSKKFSSVLVLKGANSIIAKSGKIYILDKANASLAKAGSGDALSGIIASLLAQGYKPLKAAITGALMHASSIKKSSINNYAINPNNIIKGIKCL